MTCLISYIKTSVAQIQITAPYTENIDLLAPALAISPQHSVCCIIICQDNSILKSQYHGISLSLSYRIVWIIILIGSGFGDPHLLTSDGFVYTYNPIGEFWMIKTTDSRFSMQARMVQALNAAGELIAATQFQAFAMQSNTNGLKSSRIHLEINNNRTGLILHS